MAVLILVIGSNAVPVEFVHKVICDSSGKHCEKNLDVIRIAVELGRLDFVSIGLTTIGISLAVGAVFGFMYIKERAEMIAAQRAEEVTSKWLDTKGSQQVASMFAKLKAQLDIPGEAADEIAGAQDDGGSDGKKG